MCHDRGVFQQPGAPAALPITHHKPWHPHTPTRIHPWRACAGRISRTEPPPHRYPRVAHAPCALCVWGYRIPHTHMTGRARSLRSADGVCDR